MKTVLGFLAMWFALVGLGVAQAQASKVYGSWAVRDFKKDIIFLNALDTFRQDPLKGPLPTFMVNPDGRGGCFVSIGLMVFDGDIPKSVNREQFVRTLKKLVENSVVRADSQILPLGVREAQGLDFGNFVYARKLVDSDSLAALALSKTGTIKVSGRDAAIQFNMQGFKNALDVTIEKNCH
jgi:hypothetical protein